MKKLLMMLLLGVSALANAGMSDREVEFMQYYFQHKDPDRALSFITSVTQELRTEGERERGKLLMALGGSILRDAPENVEKWCESAKQQSLDAQQIWARYAFATLSTPPAQNCLTQLELTDKTRQAIANAPFKGWLTLPISDYHEADFLVMDYVATGKAAPIKKLVDFVRDHHAAEDVDLWEMKKIRDPNLFRAEEEKMMIFGSLQKAKETLRQVFQQEPEIKRIIQAHLKTYSAQDRAIFSSLFGEE